MVDCVTFWRSCLIIGALVFLTEAASSPLFVCGVDVCNQDKDDQYCTEGRLARCEYCHREDDRCFTSRMADNCTTYCRELDKKNILAEERAKPCSILGNVTNGSHNSSDSPQPGQTVLTTCNTGYRGVGDPMIKCLVYGIWSRDLPSCTEEAFSVISEVTIWKTVASVAMAICVILILVCVYLGLKQCSGCRNKNISKQTSQNGAVKKDEEESLLADTPTKSNGDHQAYPIEPEDPLSSTTPKDATAPKLVASPEASRKQRTEDRSPSEVPGIVNIIHFDVNGNSNSQTYNHSNGIVRRPSIRSDNSVTIQENKETKKKEESNVPDNAPYPTQASDVGAKDNNADGNDSRISTQNGDLGPIEGMTEGSESQDNATLAGGKSDGVDKCGDNSSSTMDIHAHPEDESKPGDLALPNNTVSLNDVNGKRQSAKYKV